MTTAEVPGTPKRTRGILRKFVAVAASVVLLLVVLYAFGARFVAQPYPIRSDAMAPTLRAGERVIIDKLSYRSYRLGSRPRSGDVIVFRAPPTWNVGSEPIRSHNAAVRWLQNFLSGAGFLPPNENELITRIIATGGQKVECREDSGLTVNGEPVIEPYLDSATLGVDPDVDRCLGAEFGPVTVPRGRLWVMDDNRTHAQDSRAYCASVDADAERGILCTGDPGAGTIAEEAVIGRAWRF
ncbi:signal peptidase I [Mycobacterium sp. 1164985.4]|uniref:signal peptidase I n=1 Tax=Mycobacterium sp. 1164985.4 TaxID=1834069 RepID=UPI0009EF2B84|nr:signal peptidase I [Mycobacterium sp. 1164985.4]